MISRLSKRASRAVKLQAGPFLLLATLFFSIQIYCDFSGYSDIARGLAKLLGFDLMVNFKLPYFALSPSDFWRRWHVSLSSWLRDRRKTQLPAHLVPGREAAVPKAVFRKPRRFIGPISIAEKLFPLAPGVGVFQKFGLGARWWEYSEDSEMRCRDRISA